MKLGPGTTGASGTEVGHGRAAAQRCDVILVNHHGAADVLGALASLDSVACGVVHLVDNSVAPAQEALLRAGMARIVEQAPPGQALTMQLHISPSNLGFGAACNLAFAHCQADTVLLLNPDARLRPGALQQLQDTLAATPRLAAVAPRIDWTQEGHLVMPNLSSQSPAARIAQALACRLAPWSPGAFAARGARHARRTMRLMSSAGGGAFDAPALSGAVLLLRRRAVLQAGGLFDPAYFMFFEDTDLAQRLRRAGWRLQVQPHARAWHAWHNRPEKAVLMAQSERTYLRRYHPLGDGLQHWLVPRLHADPWRHDVTPVPRVNSAAAARRLLGRLWAITPLASLHPAGVRAGGAARELSDEEWALLDPGRWYAWVQPGDDTRRAPWLRFDVERAP
jgi:GT2 family glycosyltransferase